MMSDSNELFKERPSLPKGGRQTAVQLIYQNLREGIVTLDLPPGTVLQSRQIAEQFGVSPTPVREALLLLEEESLVDIFPQSRTCVAFIDVQSAREAHFLRRSVEVEIARALALDITDPQIEQLRSIIGLQKMAHKSDDFTAFLPADNRFHELMYEMAGVGGLWDIIHARRAHLDRLRRLHLPTKGKAARIIRDHEAILAAISERDPDKAEATVRAHLKDTVSATEEIRAHFPEYFG
ncbi:MAG: GntR family transcriptional regulator [Rhodospirillales bacterium]